MRGLSNWEHYANKNAIFSNCFQSKNFKRKSMWKKYLTDSHKIAQICTKLSLWAFIYSIIKIVRHTKNGYRKINFNAATYWMLFFQVSTVFRPNNSLWAANSITPTHIKFPQILSIAFQSFSIPTVQYAQYRKY